MAYGYGMSMHPEAADVGAIALGSIAGVLQTAVLREYVDAPMAQAFLKAKASNSSTAPPFLMKQLGNFGSPSFLLGVGGGIVGGVLGAEGKLRGRLIKNEAVADGLLTYGVSAGTSGVASGIFPQSTWKAAVASDPNNPIGFSGGVVRRQGVAAPQGGITSY